MYQCERCGSHDPEHACPIMKSDVEPQEDLRASELRRPDETEAQWRRRRIDEMIDEGLDPRDIGEMLGIGRESVRGILRKKHLQKLDEPLRSSLKDSFTNHTPDDAQVERIKEIRHAADDLCELIDRVCPDNSREADIARQHLEETVMWAVKSVVLPRKASGGASSTASIFPVGMFRDALEAPVFQFEGVKQID